MPQPLISARAMQVVLWASLIFLCVGAYLHVSAPSVAVSHALDSDKEASELNHHIAGMFLVAIGLSLILSERQERLQWMRWLPPVLFILAGLFLAAWSDNEIWPRGTLSWSWLLHHDAEARQHKLYALLLAALGSVEAMQLLPKLRRPWMKAVFPVLCVIGGISLLFHHHSGEVGLARPASSVVETSHYHHHEASADTSTAPARVATAPHAHEHGLTGVAAKVQKEHVWFAVIGLCVALFKFLYDSTRPPVRIPRYLWVNSVILLGLLLILYTE